MGFFDVLFLLVLVGIPSASAVLVLRAKERRLERTDPNKLQHDLHVRMLEMSHEARVLELPAPATPESKGLMQVAPGIFVVKDDK